MSESSPMQLPLIVHDYIDGLPPETRLQLLRAAVLRWFHEPLFAYVREEQGELVNFDEFIQLPVIVRTSRNTYSVLSTMKEELVSIFRGESAEAFERVNLLAASFFHRSLDDVYVTQVSTVIEEIAYLSQVDPDACAERLAEFGYRALLSGWVEAADRASMVARPAIAQANGIAHLAIAVRLLEGAVSAVTQGGRLARSELRRLNSLANEAESADYATESLRLLATLVRELTVAKEQRRSNWLDSRESASGEASIHGRTDLQIYSSVDAPLPVIAVARPGEIIASDEEEPTSRASVTIKPSEEFSASFRMGSFTVRTMAHAGSALLTALVSIVLALAGAGVGILLSHIKDLGSAWIISGFFSPTVVFFILRISAYIAERNDQRARRRVRTRK